MKLRPGNEVHRRTTTFSSLKMIPSFDRINKLKKFWNLKSYQKLNEDYENEKEKKKQTKKDKKMKRNYVGRLLADTGGHR